MQFTAYTLSLAAAATLALAAPAPKNDEFHFGFTTGNTLVSANLISGDNQPAGQFYINAERLSVYPGVPASLKGSGSAKDLVFDTTTVFGDGTAVAVVQPVGDASGVARPVIAYQTGGSDPKWGATKDGQIVHTLDAALNTFFLCKQTIGGEEHDVLSWGNMQLDGSAPEGCAYTTVRKI